MLYLEGIKPSRLNHRRVRRPTVKLQASSLSASENGALIIADNAKHSPRRAVRRGKVIELVY